MSSCAVIQPSTMTNMAELGNDNLVPALPEADLLSHESYNTVHLDDSKLDESFWNTLADITQTNVNVSLEGTAFTKLSADAGTSQIKMSLNAESPEHFDLADMDDNFDFDLNLPFSVSQSTSATLATSLPVWKHSRCSSGSSSDLDSGMDADSDSGCESTTSPGSAVSVSDSEAMVLLPLTACFGEGTDAVGTTSKSQTSSNNTKHRFSRTRPTVTQPRTSEALVASITDRERELLVSKGETVPTAASLPLTKMEERRLRASLRKIRNKDSAIRSRKKKEVYVAGLEHRVEECTRINIELNTKVSSLEATNKSLLEQLNDLRRQISLVPNDSSVGSTMMMMVIVCCGLVVSDSGMGSAHSSSASVKPSGFRSRTLQSASDSGPMSSWWLDDQDDLFVSVVFTAVLRWIVAFAVAGAFWFWMKSYTRQRQAKLR